MAQDVRAHLIAVAESYAGVPWMMPPSPPQSYDCSSYVLQVHAAVYLLFPPEVRTAEQIREASLAVAWDAVQPGDLLFFTHTYEPSEPPGPDGHTASHLGFSYGAGTFRCLNCVEPSVQITDISTSYWQLRLFQARRHPDIAAEPSESAAVASGGSGQ